MDKVSENQQSKVGIEFPMTPESLRAHVNANWNRGRLVDVAVNIYNLALEHAAEKANLTAVNKVHGVAEVIKVISKSFNTTFSTIEVNKESILNLKIK